MSVQSFVEETLEKMKKDYPIESLIGEKRTIGIWLYEGDPDVSRHSENEEGFSSDEVRALLEPKMRSLYSDLNFTCKTSPHAIEFFFEN